MIHHSTIVFVDFYQIKGRLLIFPFFSILRLCLIVVDIISQRRSQPVVWTSVSAVTATSIKTRYEPVLVSWLASFGND